MSDWIFASIGSERFVSPVVSDEALTLRAEPLSELDVAARLARARCSATHCWSRSPIVTTAQTLSPTRPAVVSPTISPRLSTSQLCLSSALNGWLVVSRDTLSLRVQPRPESHARTRNRTSRYKLPTRALATTEH